MAIFGARTLPPGRLKGWASSSFRLVPAAAGQAQRGLEIVFEGGSKTDNYVAVTHPDLNASKLRFAAGQVYRLGFSFQGAPTSPVFRHPQIAAPLGVRVTHIEGKHSGKSENSYQWFSFYPSAEGRREAILLVPPGPDRWRGASVTFFFWQPGTYRLGDVTLEVWAPEAEPAASGGGQQGDAAEAVRVIEQECEALRTAPTEYQATTSPVQARQ